MSRKMVKNLCWNHGSILLNHFYCRPHWRLANSWSFVRMSHWRNEWENDGVSNRNRKNIFLKISVERKERAETPGRLRNDAPNHKAIFKVNYRWFVSSIIHLWFTYVDFLWFNSSSFYSFLKLSMVLKTQNCPATGYCVLQLTWDVLIRLGWVT